MPHGNKKGGGFERQTCKAISKWMTNGERDDLLWRTAMSGGRATMMAKKGQMNKSQVGDIGAIDPEGNRWTDCFVTECKFRANMDFMSSVLRCKGRLYRWWVKLAGQAASVDKAPVMIVRQNHVPTLLLVTDSVVDRIDDEWFQQQCLFRLVSWGDVWVFYFNDLMKTKCHL